jgi:hypothetical protein
MDTFLISNEHFFLMIEEKTMTDIWNLHITQKKV